MSYFTLPVHFEPAYYVAYNYLFPDYIPGNPDEADAQMLHEKGWDLVEEYFLNVRIETLFLQKGIDKYGLYDQEQRTVLRVRPVKEKNSVSLFNMAATHALVKGARVFLESKENMPFQETEINALFRY